MSAGGITIASEPVEPYSEIVNASIVKRKAYEAKNNTKSSSHTSHSQRKPKVSCVPCQMKTESSPRKVRTWLYEK